MGQVPEHPAHRGLHRPELATRRPRQILEQISPRSTTIPTKDEGRRMKAEDSQQTISRELHPHNRQVRLVYRCWNLAGKVPSGAAFGDPRRAFQAAILTRHVVAATGDRT